MALPLPNSQVRVMRAHDGPAYCARFSNSGKYCITGGSDRSVKLWNPYRSEPGEEDVEGGSPLLIQTFKGPHGHPVHDVVMYVQAPCAHPRTRNQCCIHRHPRGDDSTGAWVAFARGSG